MPKRKSESTKAGTRSRRTLAYMAMAALLAGCGSVTTLEGERLSVRSDGFAAYVERVFREQNSVTSEIAFAIEDTADDARLAALEEAEEALLAACAGLNELAAARRDGDRLGPLRSLDAAREAPDCERATAAARALLEDTSELAS